MPRIIGDSYCSRFSRIACKRSLVLFLIGQVATSAWGVNTFINVPDNTQKTITAANNAIVVGPTGILNYPTNNIIIFDVTAPGANPLANDPLIPNATVAPPIPANSTGTAIIVLSGGQINAANANLAIDANAATLVGGGNIFINNAGTISVAGGGDVISMGASTGSMNLANSGVITGNIVANNGVNKGSIITNSGTITGGIDVVLGNLTNSGTITAIAGDISVVNITNTKTGRIDVQNIKANNGTIVNDGYLNLQATGAVDAATLGITNNGTIVTAGTINSPITFGNNNGTLTVNGGAINKTITGGTGQDVININTPTAKVFTISKAIDKINTINIQGDSQVTIQNTQITGVSSQFTTLKGPTATHTITIIDNSDLSGGGAINNAGTITLINNGTIGAAVPMGDLTNSGTITTAVGSDIKVGAINNQSNATLTIESKVITKSNQIINAGTLNIRSVGIAADLSSSVIGTTLMNSGILTLDGNATMMNILPNALGNVNNTGTINIKNAGGLKINGSLTNNHLNAMPAQLNLTKGNVSVGDINNISGAIAIGDAANNVDTPDLSSIFPANPSILNNYANQTITVTGKGTIGQNSALDAVNNNGTIIINTAAAIGANGDVKIGNFTNNNANAKLNITKGVVKTGNINNTLGTITIGDVANVIDTPDLSGAALSKSILSNSANQTITVTGKGTIGKNNALGAVNNNGTIIINTAAAIGANGDVKIGDFTNNNANSVLKITNGVVKTGNINNTLGTITIGDQATLDMPDLSGAAGGETVINADGQIISIVGKGTVGKNNALGVVNNSGTININTAAGIGANGDVKIGDFNNNTADAELNITKGVVKTSNINNTLGTITIGDEASPDTPDLSVTNVGVDTLTNTATITVLGAGTIGANGALGKVANVGIIKASGGDITIGGTFTNNKANAQLNLSKGKMTTGNIFNTIGSINIIGVGNGLPNGPDLSSVAGNIDITNNANQTITIDRGGTIGANTALGKIDNSGTINFNAEFNDTNNPTPIQNAIFKAGAFVNQAGAKTIINNVNAGANSVVLTGVTNSGIFSINNTADIAKVSLGAITNNAGATFNIKGPITAGGNFANNKLAGNLPAGIVNIGADFDIVAGNTFTNDGTVNMLTSATMPNGNYTLGATGLHVVSINNGTPTTLTLNNGVATINANSRIQINTTGENFIFRDNVPVGNIFAGSNAAVLNPVNNIIGNTDLLSFTLNIDPLNANNIQLISHCKSIASILEKLNNTNSSNATISQSFGAALDKIVRTGASGTLGELVFNLQTLGSEDAVKEAANQLIPDNNLAETNFDSPSTVINVAGSRLDQIARAGINNIYTGSSGYAAGSMQSDGGLWIKGLGGSNLQKQKDALVGYNANSYGTAFGADAKILSDTWFGISGSFVGTKIKTKDFPAKRTSVNSYQTTLYASLSKENYYIDAFAGMAFNAYKKLRLMQYAGFEQTATAKFMGLQPAFKLATGYIHSMDVFRLIPNVSVQYSVLHQRAYSETGAGNASLKVAGANLTQLEFGVGFKLAIFHQEKEDVIFNPDIHFMFLHDSKAQAQDTVAEFMGGGGKFSIPGATPNKDTYNIGAGLTLIRDDRLHVTGNYELKMKSKFIGHSGSLAVRYEL